MRFWPSPVDIWGEAQTVVYDDKGVADSYENFCKFAYEVSSIRPHSVSVERHGKGYKHVVGSLRTNLTEDATEKLIYVYYNYHLDPTKREKTMPHLGVNASVEAERDEAAQELDEADLVDEVTTYKLLADLATCARKGDDGEESLDDEADEEDEEDEEDEDEEEEFEFELPSGYRVAPPPEKIEHALKVNNLIAMKFDGWGWAGGRVTQVYGPEHRRRRRYNCELKFFSDHGKTRDSMLKVKAYASTDLQPNVPDDEAAGAWVLLEKI